LGLGVAITHVDAIDDPRIADYRLVRDATLIQRRGLFVAEGRLVVERVLRRPDYDVASLLVTPAASDALPWHDAPHFNGSVLVASAELLQQVTGYAVHRGCLALVRRPPGRDLRALIASSRLLVVLEGVGNPDNVGGVFRSAAAFGADAILLSPTCCSPYYRKAVRTSMGAVLQVPFATAAPWPAALAELKRAGMRLVALTPRADAETLDVFVDASLPQTLAFLVGNEAGGLSTAVLSLADNVVRIPMRPDVDSLNLSVATGIALSRLTRRDA
jgi:tRNA G18 (ribose-2'-O)-methylase SpoU